MKRSWIHVYWLGCTVVFYLFSCKKPSELSNEGTIHEASLNMEMGTKVRFYCVKIQHTSLGLTAPHMSSKALVSSRLHRTEVASTKWADCVVDKCLTYWYLHVHSNAHQSTSIHLPEVDWPNPHTIYLQLTFAWPQSSADRLNLDSMHIHVQSTFKL